MSGISLTVVGSSDERVALTAGTGEAVGTSVAGAAVHAEASTVRAHAKAEVRRVIPCMVEPNRREDPPVPLTPQSSIAEIDAKLAARQAGFRTKGSPAAEVLEHAFEIRTVD